MTHKLLIVDDHPETLNIIERVLQHQGYQVVSSNSGIEGLRLAEVERPDLILLDVMMPEMDGTEVCRRLRADPRLAQIPIIMFTAMGEPGQKWAGFDAGADDYLVKPTEPAELVARVRAVLQNSASARDQSDQATIQDQVERSQSAGPTRIDIASSMTTALPEEGQVIAVLGVRGGSGTTTVAINLAASLAANGRETMLVDLDTVQGHIALYLHQKVFIGVQTLAGRSGKALRQQVQQQRLAYSDHLQLLLAYPNLYGRYPHLSTEATADVIDAARGLAQWVVVDLGHGISPAGHRVLERADHIVVCLRPERISLATARQLLGQLQHALSSQTALHALLFDLVADNTNVPQETIAGFLGRPLLAVVSISPVEMGQSVNKGVPLVQLEKARAAARFHDIIGQLVAVSSHTLFEEG